ncbi:MAG: RluA family pseudouridine synthase, partial [Campylobacterota bacterium]|nr:RluA family pseudouridine synthase [Campylobacterota bacterium]
MPFVKKRFVVPEEVQAFLYLIRAFDMRQGDAQRLIARGRLLINGKSMFDSSRKIEGEIELVYFEAKSRGVDPLFEAKDFLVYEKESGVLVHPNTMATEYSLLDEIRDYAGDDANAVHRIDMETSGLLMASKNKKTEPSLKMLFEKRKIKKIYLAWVDGYIDNPFQVDARIKVRDNYDFDKHKVCVDDAGKHAQTYFEPLQYNKNLDATLLTCSPHTGRTHQIRVHLFHVKHPILGDPIYGSSFEAANDYLEGQLKNEDRLRETGASRLLLHAQSLKFHYKSDYEIVSRVDFEKMKSLVCEKELRRFNKRSH